MGTDWQPVTGAERYRSIDILRGLALFGVLMVNLTDFRMPLLESIMGRDPFTGVANEIVKLVIRIVLEFKAITIFSFLFGVGMAIQAERRNENAAAFLQRRLGWLLVFGVIHLLLIWNGDILMLYAVCGLLTLPFLRLPNSALWQLGAAAILWPEILPWVGHLPSREVSAVLAAKAHVAYGSGGYFAALQFRWEETQLLIVQLLLAILPRTLGLMLLGVATWRNGIFQDPKRYRRWLTIAFLVSAPAGAVVVWFWFYSVFSPLLLALAYVTGFLLWVASRHAPRLPRVAALGQMALTNYLMQSVVLGLVFYGYGFGLYGKLGAAATACIGVALYASQLLASFWWLQRYQFGPAEWLWRSLTYGRRQEFRKLLAEATI